MSLMSIISQMAGGNAESESVTPESPASISAEYLNFSAILTWPSATNALTYQVQRATVSDFSDATTVYEGSLLTATVLAMLNKEYFFRVRGVNGSNVAAWVDTTLAALSDGTTGDTVYFFGDSITVGVGASVEANRWTTLLSVAKGWTENNSGASGTVITENTCRPVFELSAIPNKTASLRYLFISFGVNDAFVNPEITPEAYTAAIEAAVANAVGKGWPAYRIIILSPFFTTYDGNHINYCNPTLSDEARKQLFVTAAENAVVNTETNFVDVFNTMKDNGGSGLLADQIHPNDSGYAYVDSLIETLINE